MTLKYIIIRLSKFFYFKGALLNMKKKIICMIIAITVILSCFVGCDKTEPEESSSPLKVVDTVSDPWGRELQKIYYNEISKNN